MANGIRAAPLWDSKKQSFVGKEERGRQKWWGREGGTWQVILICHRLERMLEGPSCGLAWGSVWAQSRGPICGIAVTS